jgi:pimeloyl-ACP methyl ester carboxylesterase
MEHWPAFVPAALGLLVSSGACAADTARTHRNYEVRGATLRTERFGHGPPVIFLHGGGRFFDAERVIAATREFLDLPGKDSPAHQSRR